MDLVAARHVRSSWIRDWSCWQVDSLPLSHQKKPSHRLLIPNISSLSCEAGKVGSFSYRESPLDCKEIKSVHPKGNQSWIFIGRTDAEAETPILWPPDVKSGLFWKDPDAGKDWRQEEKGTTEDEMAGWHHWLDGCESGWTLGVGVGQGGLACCHSWGCKELNMTEQLNWNELKGN